MTTNRPKRLLLSGLAGLGILAGAAGIANATTGQSSANRPAAVQQERDAKQDPSFRSSVTTADNHTGDETSEAAGLQALAKISAEDAKAAALAKVAGTAGAVELDNENGNVVYSVKVTTAKGVVDVKVDAGNGTVLSQQADDSNESVGKESDTKEGAGQEQSDAPESSNAPATASTPGA